MGMNIFFSVSPYVTFFRWIKVIELGLFGYYIVKTKPSLSKTVFALSIPMMYSSIIAIAQFIFQRSIGGALWFLGERTFTISTPGISRVDWCWYVSANCTELLRPYATFPHPNVLAGFLAITICVVLWQILSRQVHAALVRVWFWITIILGVIALGLTFSRGVWLVAIIAVVTIVGTQYKKRLTHMALWILLISGGCIIVAFPYFLLLLQQSESVVIRNELSRAAVLMWKSYPLLGVGLNAFLVRLPTIPSSSPTFFLQPAHTIYLLLLSELGIIGVGGIGLSIYMLISKLSQLPNKLPLLLLIVYGLLGTIDHYPVTLQQGQLVTTLVLTIGFLSR
jgi:hypothetical protein